MPMDIEDRKEFQFANFTKVLLESESIMNPFSIKSHLVIHSPKAD